MILLIYIMVNIKTALL